MALLFQPRGQKKEKKKQEKHQIHTDQHVFKVENSSAGNRLGDHATVQRERSEDTYCTEPRSSPMPMFQSFEWKPAADDFFSAIRTHSCPTEPLRQKQTAFAIKDVRLLRKKSSSANVIANVSRNSSPRSLNLFAALRQTLERKLWW